MKPAQAMLSTPHAQRMREAKPQRTAEARLEKPPPIIALVMVCVVDTGIPIIVSLLAMLKPTFDNAMQTIVDLTHFYAQKRRH